MRQLAVALRERTLQLGQPVVQTLVRQALYHVGCLTDEETPTPLWRSDWEVEGGMLCTLCEELTALAAELEQVLWGGCLPVADVHVKESCLDDGIYVVVVSAIGAIGPKVLA